MEKRGDYKLFYDKISSPLRRYPAGIRFLNRLNTVLTGFVYVAYPAFVLYLFGSGDKRWLKVTAVPAVFFVLLSVLRRGVNRPRPYESWEITPLIRKDTKGKSMPSRHVFSAAIISMAFYSIWPPAGIFLLLWSCLLAAVRVLGGVHYPSDVLAGLLIGVGTGLLMLTL
ncbi:MAG: phosphatase PAP2 family protein [Lachnospiraceae bacterium]|nr:phosphatase PAP2 family protein [Lachnospiraceae bacterium]